MADWGDVDELRERTGISDPPSDTLLGSVLRSVQSSIISFLGYDPTPKTSTLYLTGNGTMYLPIPTKFVYEVTEVREDRHGKFGVDAERFPATSVLVAGKDYSFDVSGGVLVRFGMFWPWHWQRGIDRLANSREPAEGSVKVTCRSGMGLLPGTTPSVDLLDPLFLDALYFEATARTAAWATGMGIEMSASLDSHSRSVTALPGGGGGANARSQGSSGSPFVSPITEAMLWRLRRTAIY